MCQCKHETARSRGEWQGMNWIRQEKRLAIYIRDGFRCLHCSRSLKKAAPGEIALDHVRPFAKGGCNCASNLVTSCGDCNKSRGMKSVKAFGSNCARIAFVTSQPLNMKLAKSLYGRRKVS